MRYFLVAGCKDPNLLGNSIIERTHTQLSLYCEGNRQSQVIKCQESEWLEDIHVCPGEQLNNDYNKRN